MLLKLIADRPRDHVDITEILLTQGQLDVSYMQPWAVELNVWPKLEAALKEHGHLC